MTTPKEDAATECSDTVKPPLSNEERMAASSQCLRIAAMHLVMAGEEALAVRVDALIDDVDRTKFLAAN